MPSGIMAFNPGSSPRVWGEARALAAEAGVKRIIPTRVGRSAKRIHDEKFKTDHPHACGEKATPQK